MRFKPDPNVINLNRVIFGLSLVFKIKTHLKLTSDLNKIIILTQFRA